MNRKIQKEIASIIKKDIHPSCEVAALSSASFPGGRKGKCSPDMVDPGRTKVASAVLQEFIGLGKARERKPQSQLSWSSRLGVRR